MADDVRASFSTSFVVSSRRCREPCIDFAAEAIPETTSVVCSSLCIDSRIPVDMPESFEICRWPAT